MWNKFQRANYDHKHMNNARGRIISPAVLVLFLYWSFLIAYRKYPKRFKSLFIFKFQLLFIPSSDWLLPRVISERGNFQMLLFNVHRRPDQTADEKIYGKT